MNPINIIIQTNPVKTIIHMDPAWTMEESHKEGIQYPDGYISARRPLGSLSKSTLNRPKRYKEDT